MIELKTGKIVFSELDMAVRPLMAREDFVLSFPGDRILQIRDMKNGYIWYDVREKIYEEKIPLGLCFNPRGELEFVEIYPQFAGGRQSAAEEGKREKEYCDRWLVEFCGLKRAENSFPWGTLSSYFDPRSYSAGISLHYTK